MFFPSESHFHSNFIMRLLITAKDSKQKINLLKSEKCHYSYLTENKDSSEEENRLSII